MKYLFFFLLLLFGYDILIANDTSQIDVRLAKFAAREYICEKKMAAYSLENGNDIIHFSNDSFYYFTHNTVNKICRVNLNNGSIDYYIYEKPLNFLISKIYIQGNWLVLYSEESDIDNMTIQSFSHVTQTYGNAKRISSKEQLNMDFCYIVSDTLFILNSYPQILTYIDSDKAIFLTKVSLKDGDIFKKYFFNSDCFEFYFIGNVRPFKFFGSNLYWIENNSSTIHVVDIYTGEHEVHKVAVPSCFHSIINYLADSSILKIKESRIYSQPINSLNALNNELAKGAFLHFDMFISDTSLFVVSMDPRTFKYYLSIFNFNSESNIFSFVSIKELVLYNSKNKKIIDMYFPPFFSSEKILNINDEKILSVDIVHKKSRFKLLKNKRLNKFRNEYRELKKPKLWIIKSYLL